MRTTAQVRRPMPAWRILTAVYAASLVMAGCGGDEAAAPQLVEQEPPATTTAIELEATPTVPESTAAPSEPTDTSVPATTTTESAAGVTETDEMPEDSEADSDAEVEEAAAEEAAAEEAAAEEAATETEQPFVSEWIHDSYVDDATGSTYELLGVWDTEKSFGGIFDPPLLLVICIDGREWEAEVDWGNILIGLEPGEGPTARYQIDGGEWITELGYGSTGFSSWFPRYAEDFITAILDARSLSWIPVSREDGPIWNLAVFPVAGLRQELTRLSCEWE